MPENINQQPEISPEIEKKLELTPAQDTAKQVIIEKIQKGQIDYALIISEDYALPEEFLKSPKIQAAAKEGIIHELLGDGGIDGALWISMALTLPTEIIQSAAKEAIIDELKRDNTYYVFEIIKKFNLSEEIVQSAAKEAVFHSSINGKIDTAQKIIKEFNLSEEVVQVIAKKMVVNELIAGRTDSAHKIIEQFDLPSDIIHYGDKKIAKEFFLQKEFLKSPEVQNSAIMGFLNSLSKNNTDKAFWIKEKFFSSQITNKEIIKQDKEFEDFINKLNKTIPKLHDQIFKSLELLIEFYKYKSDPEGFLKILENNPFLNSAILENPRFGAKLAGKFKEFDKLSQKNIRFLYDTKKSILQENPDLDSESLEFRQLMQEKIKNYASNKEILNMIEKQGINVDKWLNYAETSYFNLDSGEGSHLMFSETIQAPIERIKETINSYAHTLKEVLKEYRHELSKFPIQLEDTKEIEEKISKMQLAIEKARGEGNEKKAQGIEKGIEGLKKKIENIKTVSLWDKLVGDISAFSNLKNDVYLSQENLMKIEKELNEKLSEKAPSGKVIQEYKEKNAKAKEDLKNKFNILETRINNFKNGLIDLLSPCLGKDRSEALNQEIDTALAEQFDHYNSDRSTLINLFSEKGDKAKNKMENQPMNIFVWARNPDIDLYQGNYSPCCICIDSKHRNYICTIADYNTDLGIQIVNIYDETRNEPVTAAWCWLGVDKNGKTALVVDNIESNTLYSTNFSHQLTNKLFEYLKKYAQNIGVDRIVLGRAHNDLPTSSALVKLPNIDSTYNKIGGYNRENGYYLEAEDKSVKLIWENKKLAKQQSRKSILEIQEGKKV